MLTVPYRCNRAVIFVSDQYHESLPFRFAPGYSQRRANLTLLFGDRWSPLPALRGPEVGMQVEAGRVAGPGATDGDGSGWDVFD